MYSGFVLINSCCALIRSFTSSMPFVVERACFPSGVNTLVTTLKPSLASSNVWSINDSPDDVGYSVPEVVVSHQTWPLTA